MKPEQKKYFRIAGTAFLLFLAMEYWKPFTQMVGIGVKAAMPLLIGGMMAYVVNILMSFYEHHFVFTDKKIAKGKHTRVICLIGALATLVLIVTAVICLVVPELISCIQLLLSEAPQALKSVSDWLVQFAWLPETIEKAVSDIDWQSMLTTVFDVLSSGIGNTVSIAMGALSSVASSVVNLVIGAIFAIYLLFGKEQLQRQGNKILARYVKPVWNERLHYVLNVMNGCFHRYIVGQCTEAVILGLLCTVGMLLFRFPYAIMTGTVIGVTALIPVAGAYIGGAVGFLLIISVSPLKAVLFLIYLVVLQQLEGNLIYPRVVGSSIGLPGIWVLAAVTVGGGIFGIAGMLFGVPLAAAAYQLLRQDVNREEK